MSVSNIYPDAAAMTQALGISEDKTTHIASAHFIFNHFSKQKSHCTPLQRIRMAFHSAVSHATSRIYMLDGCGPAFFSANENYNRDAITIAAICSPFLQKDSGTRDMGIGSSITDETVHQAYLIQEDAAAIRNTADIDYKGPRGDNDSFLKEAYFLAGINLFEKMNLAENPDVTYESLSDHLLHDLICASRYVNRNTGFGYMLAKNIEMMEDRIVERLKLYTPVHIIIDNDDGPKLNFK